jgi:DinB superfamily
MPDQSLLLLLDEVRGKTLRILDPSTVANALWAPPGLQNTILGHGGHAYFLLEWLTMHALDRPPQLPGGWYLYFSWDSRPAEVPADRWPPLTTVIAQLHDQHERMRRIVGKLSGEQLDQPSARNPQKTVRYEILQALHDEACHCGEIHLLRKLQAVGSGRPKP